MVLTNLSLQKTGKQVANVIKTNVEHMEQKRVVRRQAREEQRRQQFDIGEVSLDDPAPKEKKLSPPARAPGGDSTLHSPGG